MKKIVNLIMMMCLCCYAYSQNVEYKSNYISSSESIGNNLTSSTSNAVETSIFFNYRDSIVVVNSANKKRAYWIVRCYEDLKDYVDVTDNISNYTFTFLYNKYGVTDVLLMEERQGTTYIVDFSVYRTIKK